MTTIKQSRAAVYLSTR